MQNGSKLMSKVGQKIGLRVYCRLMNWFLC